MSNGSYRLQNLVQTTYRTLYSSKSLALSKKISCQDETKHTISSPIIMKGILVEKFGDKKELKVKRDIPVPFENYEDLKPNEVVVKVIASGINPIDTYIRSGMYAMLPSLPYIPGMDAAGYIEAVGSQVCSKKLSVGSRVFITGPGKNSGTYAEYTRTNQNYVFPLDDRLSFSQGASIGIPYFTAYRALMHCAKLTKDKDVLIHGASGAVGLAATQFASFIGAKVHGTAGTEEGMKVVLENGAHHVLNHHEEGYEVKLKDITNGIGFDIIIENLANVNLERDLQMIKKNARIIIVGSRGPITINPRHLMGPEASIKGVSLWNATDDEYQQMGESINDGINSGWLNPMIDKEYSIENAPIAHHDIINSKGAKGNLVLVLN